MPARLLCVLFSGPLCASASGLVGSPQTAAEFPMEASLVATIPGAERLQAADVDGDGFTDLVALAEGGSELVWLRNRGDLQVSGSTYQPARTLVRFTQVAYSPENSALAVGDTNGDGRVDFYVSSGGGPIFEILNLGHGLTAVPRDLTTSLAAPHLAIGPGLSLDDIDADGDLDLVITNPLTSSFLHRPMVFENLGGVLTAVPSPDAFDRPARDLDAADLDGDGDRDFVVAGPSSAWIESVGGQLVRHPDLELGIPYDEVVASDLDLDGDLDLLFLGARNPLFNEVGTIVVAENRDGLGDFLVHPGQRPAADRTRALDVDGDGDLDLLVAGRRTDGQGWLIPSWMENRGAFRFEAATALAAAPVERIRSMRLADINGDGFLDVLFSQRGGAITAIPGQAPVGQLALRSDVIELSRAMGSLQGLTRADLDGDGDMDFVISSDERGLRVVMQEQGGSLTAPARVLPELPSTRQCRAGDLDGDGRADLLVRTTDGSVAFSIGQAGGGFTAPVFLGTRGSYSTVAAIDLDRDGDRDIVCADVEHQQFIAFDQISAGQFDTLGRTLVGSIEPGAELSVIDIDDDGVDDLLAVATSLTSDVLVLALLVDGAGGVSATGLGGFPAGAARFVPCEMNGDGITDLAWMDAHGPAIRFREGGPGLSFGPVRKVVTAQAAGTTPHRLRAAHLNTDGISDFLVGHGGTDLAPVARVLSRGPGLWGPLEDLPSNGRPGNVLMAADLDSDGDADLVVGSRGEEFLSLYRSELFGPIGVSECGPGVPNSTGVASTIQAAGSTDLLDRSLLLRAQGLPAGEPTLFLASQTSGFVPNPGGSPGNLCLGGPIGRFVGPGQIQLSSTSGTAELGVDLGAIPQPDQSVSVLAGQTWRFQAWHRDRVAGQPASNFTDARAVAF